MTVILSKDEAKFLKDISKIYYIEPIKQRVDSWVASTNNPKIGWINVLNHLNEILKSSQGDVEDILDKRINTGKITDKSQARKSIVGAAFSSMIIYIFIQNKLIGNISSKIYITAKKSTVDGFEKISTINVGEETQKPDMDLN